MSNPNTEIIDLTGDSDDEIEEEEVEYELEPQQDTWEYVDLEDEHQALQQLQNDQFFLWVFNQGVQLQIQGDDFTGSYDCSR